MEDILDLLAKAEQSLSEVNLALQTANKLTRQSPELAQRVSVILGEQKKAATLFREEKIHTLRAAIQIARALNLSEMFGCQLVHNSDDALYLIHCPHFGAKAKWIRTTIEDIANGKRHIYVNVCSQILECVTQELSKLVRVATGDRRCISDVSNSFQKIADIATTAIVNG